MAFVLGSGALPRSSTGPDFREQRQEITDQSRDQESFANGLATSFAEAPSQSVVLEQPGHPVGSRGDIFRLDEVSVLAVFDL